MGTLRELLDQRAALLKAMKEIVDQAEAEKRDLNSEEEARYAQVKANWEALTRRIERRQQLAQFEQAVNVGGHEAPNDRNPWVLGMDKRDVKRYSIARAIRAVLAQKRDMAPLEMEASEAVSKQLGREPRGFFIPGDVLIAPREARAMKTTDGPTGGYTVATELLAGSFIEMLRNRLAIWRAGASTLTDLVGNVDIVRQIGGSTAHWVGEEEATPASTLSFDLAGLRAKEVAGFVPITRKLLQQSSQSIDALIIRDMNAAIAAAIDYAALHEDGTNEKPLGIANTTGVGLVVGGDNGAVPTWSHIVGLETEVSVSNADVASMTYITNARMRGTLKQQPKVANTATFIWESDNTMNGYRAIASNQVRSDLTKGTATNCSAIFFGDFSQLLVGFWGGIDVNVDDKTLAENRIVRLFAYQTVDVLVRQPAAFAVMLDALPL